MKGAENTLPHQPRPGRRGTRRGTADPR